MKQLAILIVVIVARYKVAEEDAIVSEITFGQTDQGAARCNGTTISADKARGTIRSGLSGYLQSESRETTIANGLKLSVLLSDFLARKTAQELASALRLQEHFVESAVRYFKLALQKNCTRGRRTEVTLSACLYITCRYEKTSHMLIDFSDVIQTSVFILGSTFLKLVQALHLQIFLWSIPHFIFLGLLLAARIHHFNRSLEDIMMVVKMSSDYLDAQEAKLRREKQGLDSGSKKRPRVSFYNTSRLIAYQRKNTPKQKVSAGTPAEAAIQLLEQQNSQGKSIMTLLGVSLILMKVWAS
ncbi:transcription factor TFIIIB subunit brf1 [Massospora cicadina]|nr:transcription factor TFIIIB subunit brf1 [Massospora cicadina]